MFDLPVPPLILHLHSSRGRGGRGDFGPFREREALRRAILPNYKGGERGKRYRRSRKRERNQGREEILFYEQKGKRNGIFCSRVKEAIAVILEEGRKEFCASSARKKRKRVVAGHRRPRGGERKNARARPPFSKRKKGEKEGGKQRAFPCSVDLSEVGREGKAPGPLTGRGRKKGKLRQRGPVHDIWPWKKREFANELEIREKGSPLGTGHHTPLEIKKEGKRASLFIRGEEKGEERKGRPNK